MFCSTGELVMEIFRKIVTPLCNNMQQLFMFQSAVSSVTRSYSSLLLRNHQSVSKPINLLVPVIPLLVPNCGFKVVGKVKKRCKDCYMVVRDQRLYNICKTKPRHKQMAMKKDEDKTWILSHATQGPKRPW